jgi:hypothetical protein
MKAGSAWTAACYLTKVAGNRAPLAIVSVLVACGGSVGDRRSSTVDPEIVATAAGDVTFTGMCDASGAVPLGGARFAVADDEDNVLRVYDAELGGGPIATIDVADAILPSPAHGAIAPRDEVDLEAATRVDDVAYWLGSHGRRKNGRPAPARLRFFATTAPDDGASLAVLGSTDRLLGAILAEPTFAALGLAAAAQLAPTAPGGLNIEGLSRRAAGGVWIAFRSPVVDGDALVLGLENPMELIRGEPARFVEPVRLDLGGLGIRAMTSWRGQHVIVAGHPVHGERSRLYVWDGEAEPREVTSVDLTNFNAEAFFSRDDRALMLLSDDGTVRIQEPGGKPGKKGKPCKRLRDPTRKRFHGRPVELPSEW